MSTADYYHQIHRISARPRWTYAVLLALQACADAQGVVRDRRDVAEKAQELIGDRGYEGRRASREANVATWRRELKELNQAFVSLQERARRGEDVALALAEIERGRVRLKEKLTPPAAGNVSRAISELMSLGLVEARWYEDRAGRRYDSRGRGRFMVCRLAAELRRGN